MKNARKMSLWLALVLLASIASAGGKPGTLELSFKPVGMGKYLEINRLTAEKTKDSVRFHFYYKATEDCWLYVYLRHYKGRQSFFIDKNAIKSVSNQTVFGIPASGFTNVERILILFKNTNRSEDFNLVGLSTDTNYRKFLGMTPEMNDTNLDIGSIEPYDDARDKVLRGDLSKMTPELLKTLWFNQNTRFGSAQNAADKILTDGMNPGLGIRALHEQGVTGKGVTVAVIDTPLVSFDHPEYSNKIIEYYGVLEGVMHGPAVLSILAGKRIGTAPGVKVVYAAHWECLLDAKDFAEPLKWIIERNRFLPEGEKVRIVSASTIGSGPSVEFKRRYLNCDYWDRLVAEAASNDILVLDASVNSFIGAGYYDTDDPDNPAKFKLFCPGGDIRYYKNEMFGTNCAEFPEGPVYWHISNCIYAPASFRTTAEEYQPGEDGYQYSGMGGLSLAVPYIAGVLAMGWQVGPELAIAQITNILFQTAYVTKDGFRVVNPGAFIEKIKEMQKKK